jgi:(p)ppGpp synthase/HD superfamily hydrolase
VPADEPIDERLTQLLDGATPTDAAMLAAAFALAARAHAGQLRRTGAPYIGHPLEVALILRDELGVSEPSMVAAALLHDAVEDSDLTVADLRDFPPRTRELVALLTDPAPEMTSTLRREHYQRIWRDSDATLLKAADRLSNLREVAGHPDPELRRRYVRRTRREVLGRGLPLAAHPVATPLLAAALRSAAGGTRPSAAGGPRAP